MSLSAAVLDALMASGATREMMAAAMKADIAEREAIERDAIEARRAKDAERQRRHRLSRDVTVTVCDNVTEALSPLAPPKVSPGPLSNTPPLPPKPETNAARGSRLTDAWKPEPLTGKALAMIERWNPGELERELAKFRNYWMAKPGKDACRTAWQRTWINWLISADERKPQNGQSNRGSGGRMGGPRPDPTLALVRAAIAAQHEDNRDYG